MCMSVKSSAAFTPPHTMASADAPSGLGSTAAAWAKRGCGDSPAAALTGRSSARRLRLPVGSMREAGERESKQAAATGLLGRAGHCNSLQRHNKLPSCPATALPTLTRATLLSPERQLQQVSSHALAVKTAKQQHISGPWRPWASAATAPASAAAAAVRWLGRWPLDPTASRLLLHRCVPGGVGAARHSRVLRQHPAACSPVKNENVTEQAAVCATPAVHQ